MARRKLIENVLSLGAVQLASHLLAFLTLPYLALRLGVDGLGRMAFALSIAQIMVVLTDYGFNLSAPKEVSIHRDDPDRLAEIWCSVTLLRVLFVLAGLMSIMLASLVVDRLSAELDLLLLAYTLVVGNVLFPQWLFQGLEQLKLVSLIQVMCRMAVLAGIFALVKGPGDTHWAVWLQSAGTLLGGLLVIPHTRRALRSGRLRWPSQQTLMHHLHDGWHVFLSTASINLYTSSNAFFLGMLTTPVQVGYYHVAEKMIKAVLTLYGPVGNAVYPHISRLVVDNPVAALAFNRRLLIRLLLAGGLVIGVGQWLAPWCVDRLFGPAYAPAVPVLQAFVWMPLFSVVAHAMGILTMIPFGLHALFSKVLVAAVVVDFIVFIPLVHFQGALGAAWANVTVECFVAMTAAVLLHRRQLNPLTSRLMGDAMSDAAAAPISGTTSGTKRSS
ncbi:flippase [Sphaerotilus uruguayifluvii]|uniref:PST family polysaccharide transporter n=1 Tax=Sphaerotilus uruguayifluvii TaxID=2735897 RepID=A0ABX2G622_9BURK|nr:PST family polysaccharide transporter [Leptothrix sp. C29]